MKEGRGLPELGIIKPDYEGRLTVLKKVNPDCLTYPAPPIGSARVLKVIPLAANFDSFPAIGNFL